MEVLFLKSQRLREEGFFLLKCNVCKIFWLPKWEIWPRKYFVEALEITLKGSHNSLNISQEDCYMNSILTVVPFTAHVFRASFVIQWANEKNTVPVFPHSNSETTVPPWSQTGKHNITCYAPHLWSISLRNRFEKQCFLSFLTFWGQQIEQTVWGISWGWALNWIKLMNLTSSNKVPGH